MYANTELFINHPVVPNLGVPAPSQAGRVRGPCWCRSEPLAPTGRLRALRQQRFLRIAGVVPPLEGVPPRTALGDVGLGVSDRTLVQGDVRIGEQRDVVHLLIEVL